MSDRNAQLTDRIREAARLRGLAYFNEFDASWFDRKRKIVYYIDPAVALLLFIWPGRLLDEREAHNKGYLATVAETGDTKKVVDAVLSGERLFLPRNLSEDVAADETRRGTFMLPDHWEEFASQLLHLMKEDLKDPATVAREFEAVLEDAQFELAAHETTFDPEIGALSAEEVDQKSAELCDAVSRLEHTRMMELAMLQRLRHQSLVRPRTGLPQDIFRIDPDEINGWSRRLKRAGKSRAVRADAAVLAQIDALNRLERDKARWWGDQAVIHCLVTGDQHIHDAFFEHRMEIYGGDQSFGEYNDDGETFLPDWDNRNRSRFLQYYTLRHPAQFVAMLNQRDLDNQIHDTHLFEGVVDTTEALLIEVTDSEADALHLSVQAVRGQSAADKEIERHITRHAVSDRRKTMDDFQQVLNRWRSLMWNTILVNRHCLGDRINASRKIYDQVRRDHGSYQSMLQDLQQGLIGDLKKIAFYRASINALDQMLARLRNVGRGRSSVRRISAHLLCDFSALTGEQKVAEVQHALEAGDKNAERLVHARLSELPEEEAWRTLLFCTVLAAGISDWERLIWIGGRAVDALSSEKSQPEDLCEALYVVGLGHRMRLNEADYEVAQKFLKDAMERHCKVIDDKTTAPALRLKERLRLARAKSEYATLRLTEQARRIMQNEPMEPLPEEVMRTVQSDFEEAIAIADEIVEGPDETRENERLLRVARFVSQQASLNLPIYDVTAHYIYGDRAEFPDSFDDAGFSTRVARAERAWEQLADNADSAQDASYEAGSEDVDNTVDQHGSIVVRVDIELLRFARDVVPAKDLIPDQLDALVERLNEYSGALIDSDVTENDKRFGREICRWMIDILEQKRLAA